MFEDNENRNVWLGEEWPRDLIKIEKWLRGRKHNWISRGKVGNLYKVKDETRERFFRRDLERERERNRDRDVWGEGRREVNRGKKESYSRSPLKTGLMIGIWICNPICTQRSNMKQLRVQSTVVLCEFMPATHIKWSTIYRLFKQRHLKYLPHSIVVRN